MGRLILYADVKSAPRDNHGTPKPRFDPFWFFPDDSCSLEDAYPVMLAIHNEVLAPRYGEEAKRKAGSLRIEIRKFIERNLTGDVVYFQHHMEHIRVYPKDSSAKSYEKRNYSRVENHGYFLFHFEDNAEATHFKLKFAEHIATMRKNHPKYPPSEGCDDFFGDKAEYEARNCAQGW